tara:strand:- start:294 stop:929 length:636 start_codon:yes stop_codon:yes gene_type:complete
MIHYYLKKIQYFFFKKYGFPKQSLDYFNNKKKKTVISFSSIEGNKLSIQKNEFFSLTKKYNILFVKDITRSWLNNVDTDLVKKTLKNDSTDFAIGYSMGAFNAIIFSNLFPIKKVIAFSPQFSIHPKISMDKTFLNYAAAIDIWKFKLLKFSSKTKYILVFGDTYEENYHMNMIPKAKNIKIIQIKNCGHETAKAFKKNNELNNLINKFFK